MMWCVIQVISMHSGRNIHIDMAPKAPWGTHQGSLCFTMIMNSFTWFLGYTQNLEYSCSLLSSTVSVKSFVFMWSFLKKKKDLTNPIVISRKLKNQVKNIHHVTSAFCQLYHVFTLFITSPSITSHQKPRTEFRSKSINVLWYLRGKECFDSENYIIEYEEYY